MPLLRDVVDAVLSDAYSARVMSDMRAVQTFSAYKDNELLSKLAMPLLSITKLEFDIPVICRELENIPEHQIAEIEGFKKASHAILATFSRDELDRELSDARKKTFSDEIDKIVNEASEFIQVSAFSRSLAASAARWFSRWKLGRIKELITAIQEQLDSHLKQEFGERVFVEDTKPVITHTTHVSFPSPSLDVSPDIVAHLKIEVEEKQARWELIPDEKEGEFKSVLVADD